MNDKERIAYEELLDRIFAMRTSAGETPGIYCADRCQLCGEVRAWSGFITAMAVHHGTDKDLVC